MLTKKQRPENDLLQRALDCARRIEDLMRRESDHEKEIRKIRRKIESGTPHFTNPS